jgi:hypothetical protein
METVCKKLKTCINTTNRGFNILLSVLGLVTTGWGIYLGMVASWNLNVTTKGIMISGALLTATTGLFAWRGHKKAWFIKCYYFFMTVLVLFNIFIIIMCLDETIRENTANDLAGKSDALHGVLSRNILVSGYVVAGVTGLEVLCLLFSILRRRDLQKRKIMMESDEDNLGEYLAPLLLEMSDDGVHETLVTSERSEHGWLHKKGTDKFNAKWKKRWFVMRDDRLEYYETPESSVPNGEIFLKDMKATRAESSKRKKTHPWTFKVFSLEDATARTYYLYARTAKKERTWLEWIRGGIKRASATPQVEEEQCEAVLLDVGPNVTEVKKPPAKAPTISEGWLHKKGHDIINAKWARRWFVRKQTSLLYYDQPDSKSPNGVVPLRSMWCTRADPSKRKKTHPWTFKLFQPNDTSARVYYFYSKTEKLEAQWIESLREGIKAANDGEGSDSEEEAVVGSRGDRKSLAPNEEENAAVEEDLGEEEEDDDNDSVSSMVSLQSSEDGFAAYTKPSNARNSALFQKYGEPKVAKINKSKQ